MSSEPTVQPQAGPGAAPEVSVVIPSHARPELLQRAVGTALAQEDVRLEVVVVDDGSPQPAESVLAHVDPGPHQLTILRNETAGGVSAARNRGIAAARGRVVALLDDDDLWAPSKLRMQLDAMAETGARWSHTGTFWIDADLHARFWSMPGDRRSTVEAIARANFVGTPSSVAADRELFLEAGGFTPALSVLADWDMWLRLAKLGGPGVAVQEPLIAYMTHAGSMHRSRMAPLITELLTLRRRHSDVGRIGGPEMWAWISDAARDHGDRLQAAALQLAIAARYRNPEALTAAHRALRGVVPRPEWARDVEGVPGWIAA